MKLSNINEALYDKYGINDKEAKKTLNESYTYNLNIPVNDWTLFYIIRRGSRSGTESFDNIDDLRNALKYYGLPLSLADFDISKFNKDNLCISNHYKSFTISAYPEINYK